MLRYGWMSVLLVACDPAGSGGGAGDVEACDLAVAWQTCDECYSGDVTCSFGSVSVTEGSCGDCQARGALYQELCDAGETATAEEIEDGTVCDDASTSAN